MAATMMVDLSILLVTIGAGLPLEVRDLWQWRTEKRRDRLPQTSCTRNAVRVLVYMSLLVLVLVLVVLRSVRHRRRTSRIAKAQVLG